MLRYGSLVLYVPSQLLGGGQIHCILLNLFNYRIANGLIHIRSIDLIDFPAGEGILRLARSEGLAKRNSALREVELRALLEDLDIALAVGADRGGDVDSGREMEGHAVGCWVEDSDVVAVVLGVFGDFAAFVVEPGVGPVEEILGAGALLFGGVVGGRAGIWLEG